MKYKLPPRLYKVFVVATGVELASVMPLAVTDNPRAVVVARTVWLETVSAVEETFARVVLPVTSRVPPTCSLPEIFA